MEVKIHRRCKCGCGQVTNPGKKWIRGHNKIGIKPSEKTKLKMSLAALGHKRNLGHKHSKKTKLKMALTKIQYDPDYKYCDEWKDRQYRRDLLKDHCENVDCKGNYKKLDNHHIDLNKKNCHPLNIMTICYPCHSFLHNNKLGKNKDHENYLTIIKPNKITYVHKKTRKRIILKRR